MRISERLEQSLEAQRGYRLPWVPVCLGIGISTYFSLRFEPEIPHYVALGLGSLALFWLGLRMATPWSWLPNAVGLALIGVMLMGARSHMVAGPVLGFRYYGPLEGRVVSVDRSASDRVRLTLDQVRLDRIDPKKTPIRVRISLPPDFDALETPRVGAQVMTTAHLSPPQGPVEPGGFDFRRHVWFQQIGAVGYTRVPVLLHAKPEVLRVQRLRTRIVAHLQDLMPDRTAGVAAALSVGDRAHVAQDTWDALRGSNLAHLLAISGLHMGLFTGLVFALLRFTQNLWPWFALRYPVKKFAAIGAMAAGFGYLVLSGVNIATERAFVMVAMMLCAVLLDRRAISVRALGFAAIILLLRRPESVLNVGFQMSFAATLALVAAFSTLNASRNFLRTERWRRLVNWGGGLIVSSFVAGLATAPYGAATFNTLSHYGLLANTLAVPVMSGVVAPAAVLSLVLAPVGLEWVGLCIVDVGLSWILWVAEWVSNLPNAQGMVAWPPKWVVPLLTIGGLILCLWQGRGRLLGAALILVSLIGWPQAERPLVLVAQDGSAVGIMTQEGRAVSRPRGRAFVIENWLRHDGDDSSQEVAHQRWPDGNSIASRYPLMRAELGEGEAGRIVLIHAIGKRGVGQISGCEEHQVIVTNIEIELPGECLLITPSQLRDWGSLAMNAKGQMTRANMIEGDRLWTR